MNANGFFRIAFALFTSILLANRSNAANPAVTPISEAVDGISAERAVLHGTIGLNGKPAHVAFQVRKADVRRWVGHTPWQKVSRGQTNVSFSATVSGLLPDTDYEVRAIALVNAVQRKGNEVSFRTAPVRPTATTGQAENITATSVILNGTVNTHRVGSTAVYFEWGTTTNYGFSIADALAGGATDEPVQATVTNLLSETTYHFRLVATNEGGVSYGSDGIFVTVAKPPVITSEAASSVTIEAATLNGTVNGNGRPATVFFDWGLNTTYAFRISTVIPASNEPTPVSTTITSLIAGATYHFRVIASNSTGVSIGADRTFVPVCSSTPVTVTVTNCTETDLRAALATGNTILFDCDGTITLTSPIDVSCILTLDASGHSVTLDGNHSVRLFNVRDSATLDLRGLTLARGRSEGTNSLVSGNGNGGTEGGSGSAGAIECKRATIIASDCRFILNLAIGGNGGTNFGPGLIPPGGHALGGAIGAEFSSLRITNCSFLGNRAAGGNGGWYAGFGRPLQGSSGDAGGGALSAMTSSVHIVNCSFRTNQAVNGGAIEVKGGTVEIHQSAFTQNATLQNGGAIINKGASLAIFASEFIGNLAAYGGETCGGAVCQWSGFLGVVDSDFDSNAAYGGNYSYGSSMSRPIAAFNGRGGAIGVVGGTALIQRSTFHGNSAVGGEASPFVGGPFFWANSGEGIGGALYSQASVNIMNCTFAQNAAAAGGIPFDISYPRPDPSAGKGGALAAVGGTLQIHFSTIASNAAYSGAYHSNESHGGGIFNSGTSLLVGNTILAWNNVNVTNLANAFGSITDGGYNLSSDTSPNFSGFGSLNNIDPLLGPLSDNGGFTLTFPLLPGSPAIDAADTLSAPITDQRGFPRPQEPAPDIGAFER